MKNGIKVKEYNCRIAINQTTYFGVWACFNYTLYHFTNIPFLLMHLFNFMNRIFVLYNWYNYDNHHFFTESEWGVSKLFMVLGCFIFLWEMIKNICHSLYYH